MRNILKLVSGFIIILCLFSTTAVAAVDKTPPSKPANLKAASVSTHTVTLAWAASKDNVGIKSYYIYKDGKHVGSTAKKTYIIKNLKSLKTYKFYIKAKDTSGNLSKASSTITAITDKTPPTQPTNLKKTSVSTNSVTLAWTSSKDNLRVKSYDIYKNGKYIGNTAKTTYTVKSLNNSQTYKFYIKAKDTAGNLSKQSNTLNVNLNAQSAKIVGYYAAWAAYSGYTPNRIAGENLTHINYAFANISDDLKITMGYPDVDPANFEKLRSLKKSNSNLKTIISVGGWSWSGKFSDVALTEASREKFADSCVEFIVNNGFDGVDIDWEYPVSGGMPGNIKRTEDKTNFTLLMKKLREKLDERGGIDGKNYILTFAGATSDSYLSNIEASKLQQYVDYANVMTYDLHGMWDSYTDLNAPLYKNRDTSPQYKASVDESINAWIKNGFSAKKIVMGIPFYGYIYNNVMNSNQGLYQTFSGSSSITYDKIAQNYLNNSAFKRYVHAESKVPWLFNGSTFISYDDEESIKLKTQYAKSKSLGGVMIWELSQNSSGVLLRSIRDELIENCQ